MFLSEFRIALAAMLLPGWAAAQSSSGPPAVTYIPGSSVKLYQVNGDCDWVEWDATINSKSPTCKATTSRTVTNADVLGDDVPVAFEHNGELIVTFGDTIGANGNGAWTTVQNSFAWQAHDPIARSTTANAADGLLLNFFLNGKHGLEVLLPPQPDGTPVAMGIDDIPHAGVSVNGTIYLGIKTGNVNSSDGTNDQSHAYSLLATFDESKQTFTSGRTVSASPGGHFVGGAFYLAPAGLLGTPPPVSPEPIVLNFGVGQQHASNLYLSLVPASEFWTGLDAQGNPATRYFTGIVNGQPTWSSKESDAVPIIYDVDPANPTINKTSVFYSQQLGLWLLVYDAGASNITGEDIYFAYAAHPWGPWSTPQEIFDPCRDKGFGNFIFYYYATAKDNFCPSAMPAGVTSAPNSAGPSGPTIGSTNDPSTTRGRPYAPALIERFTQISGNTLKLYYLMATWNPYAVVLMESDFNINYGPAISLVANAEGESPTIAPNTWVEIKGVNLAPAGDARAWQASDFAGTQMPTQLDHVSATFNGKSAYVYYISPEQINVLTPPDPISGPVQVVVSNNGVASAAFTAQAQQLSPSFFVFNGGPYVAAVHLNSTLVGSANPAKPGETVVLFANGFGATSTPVVPGSEFQSGTLSPVPVVKIGGTPANVIFAGLSFPGEFQFNVVVPPGTPDGDQPIAATYGGLTTQPGTLITVRH